MQRLLSFPGNNGPGIILLQNGAQPGDRIISVVSATGDAVDYTSHFLDRVQAPDASVGSPATTFPYLTQLINANLAGQAFIALIERADG